MNYYDLCKQLNILPFLHFDSQDVYVVYFLVDGKNQIVYIGKSDSANFMGRLRSHRKNKDFKYYSVLRTYVSEAEALAIESGLISLIRPRYNVVDAQPDAAKVWKGLNLINEMVSYQGISEPVYSIQHTTKPEGSNTPNKVIQIMSVVVFFLFLVGCTGYVNMILNEIGFLIFSIPIMLLFIFFFSWGFYVWIKIRLAPCRA